MAKLDVKSISKNVPMKYIYIAVALIVVIGVIALYRGLPYTGPQNNFQSNTYTCGQGGAVPTSDKFIILSCALPPPQPVQNGLTLKYSFVGKLKINNTGISPNTYSIAFTFHTSAHGDITQTQTWQLTGFEVKEFEFDTPDTINMLPNETATADYKISIG